MRGIAHFVGANLFLFCMLAVGAAAVVLLVKFAQLAGADDDLVHWLVYPIGVAAIAAMAYAGKLAHRTLSKIL